MVTVISRFRVRNGMEEEVRRAFLDRPRLVDTLTGFRGLDVFTVVEDPSVFLLVTRWTDEETFRAWHRSEAHHLSHKLIPRGLKLDPAFTSVIVGRTIRGADTARAFGDALEGETALLSQWLLESDTLVAVLLSGDGRILVRNRFASRVFPSGPAAGDGMAIWDYLVCSDVEHLRSRLSGSAAQNVCSFLLNVSNAQQDPVTLEVSLLRCYAGILLVAAPEHKHDARLETELRTLTNELSVMTREAARKNIELQRANETIRQLARTDALTGLSNRRTLEEAFAREIGRAERNGEPLSVVLADLDHFKLVNDRYGHLAGDEVLVKAASALASRRRAYDVAARYGGEEFLLLLPGTPIDAAGAIAERIRNDVASIEPEQCPGPITASFGVACWISGESQDNLIARADAALYRAKHGGRNRVEFAAAE